MISYNYLLEDIILPLGDRLLGSSFIKQLKRLRNEVALSEQELQTLQLSRLEEILRHATQKATYYTPYTQSENVLATQWLKTFPILDKQTLKDNSDSLLTIPTEKLLKQSSSGSSGIRSEVYWSVEEQSVHRATQILWWEWAGYRLGSPILQTGMTPARGIVKSIKDKLLRTYYMVAFAPERRDIERALTWASQTSTPFLGGYASSLFVLAEATQITKTKPTFKAAISWGDKMFDHYRTTITEAFGAPVYETYGTAEGMMIAAQKDLPYMYLMTPNVYIELLDDNGNEVPDGEIGHVVVTSLVAKSMPLIRYRIGDLAIRLPREEYPSTRNLALPLLKKVIGRDTDIVKTAGGKSMVVHTFTGILEYVQEIIQFCVIQESLTGIKIQYIPAPNFHDNVLTEITNKIQYYLQEPSFNIDYEGVEYIPPTPSGKPQIIISRLPFSSKVDKNNGA